ncbi:MAG TPA: amino acid adenylation domain-containing protein [Actinocrinis sp.]
MDNTRIVSFAEERLWFLDQLRPGALDYLLPLALRIRGELDVRALTEAFAAIVDRHDVLRTRYVGLDGEPIAVVADHGDVTIERTESADGADVLRRELSRPLDLVAGPPFRLTLARLGDGDHLLVIVVHHIAMDGWSWGVLTRELAEGYRERTTGEPARRTPAALRYADVAEAQRERFSGRRGRDQLDYWRAQLSGVPALELPTDRPRPTIWDGTGDLVRIDLPAGLLAEADRFARSRRATRYMVLLAVFQALLARASGQVDFAVGAPVAGRTRAGTQDMLGLFANTLVLRADLSGRPTFDELLARVRDTMLGAFGHADTPIERIVQELAPERDLSRDPFYQVSLSLLDIREPAALPGLAVEAVEPPVTGTPSELFLNITAAPDGTVNARLQYATALFDRARITRLAAGFAELLRAALAEPGATAAGLAARLDLLPEGERDRLLHSWNDNVAAMPDRTVTELFSEQALATPDAVAIRTSTQEIGYAELDAATSRLAHHLRALGVGPGSLVTVCLERGPQLLTALLAVLKAGGAYVPIDPAYPSSRVAFMAEDSGAEVMITQSALEARVAGATKHTVLVDRDGDRAAIEARSAASPEQTAVADDLAYIMYTSGSTGTPKGVMIHHRALTNFVLSALDRPGIKPGDLVAALTTVSFDLSVVEMYSPLVVGATVLLADREQARDPERMADLLAAAGPTHMQATPPTFGMLLDSGWRAPKGLTVLSGGEKLPYGLAARIAAHGAVVWDAYGPTEATVWAMTTELLPDGRVADSAPQSNYTLYVLDPHLEPVPVDSIGELYIGGPSVAQGYRRRPALTAEKYLPDPHGAVPGGRMYRTGDLVRRHQDGSVEILGRADRQIKVRGHRVEPGEIEAALLGHDAIRAAVVRPTASASGEPQLTAYILPRGDAVPPPEKLREFLLRTLPEAMAPTAYVVLASFPLTPSGKVDYDALPVSAVTAVEQYVAPRGAQEHTVANVWEEVLGRTRIGVHDDFFDIGGHSLLATRIAVRLRASLGIDVPVRGLFEHSTVAALAAALPDYPKMAERTPMPALTARRSRATR